jgi:hypothetical protein
LVRVIHSVGANVGTKPPHAKLKEQANARNWRAGEPATEGGAGTQKSLRAEALRLRGKGDSRLAAAAEEEADQAEAQKHHAGRLGDRTCAS